MGRITFEGMRYDLDEGQDVLSALVRGGARVEHSCRKGTCQVCMLKVVDGNVESNAQMGLAPELRASGYFLPCQCRPQNDITVARPDRSELLTRARVFQVSSLAPDIVSVLLEPERNLKPLPGQFINLYSPDGSVRSYSLANVPEEDYFLEIHVKRIPGGRVSNWIFDTLHADSFVEISGPRGRMTYRREQGDTPLLLIGTGTGIGPMRGIARDALRRGHKSPIYIVHGVRDDAHLYLESELRALSVARPNVKYLPAVSQETERGDVFHGRAVDAAFERAHSEDTQVFVAGHADAVEAARVMALGRGISRHRILADAFVFDHAVAPKDKDKIKSLRADPELFLRLENGRLLRKILCDFYDRVYEDPLLAPFFHRVTKDRAIGKQYEFLVDLMTGSKNYFGLSPFNSHHWMIISDDLFDHRENLMQQCMIENGLEAPYVGRWLALDEMFRREIVKSQKRGLIIDGKEHLLEGFREEVLEIGSICDGCERVMEPKERGRLEVRTGRLFCDGCAAARVGDTIPPS